MAKKKKRAGAKPADKSVAESAGVAPSSALPASAGSGPLPPANRDELGRWVKGQSGNAAGKPKGLKNYITRERLAMEAALRSYISGEHGMEKVLNGIDRLFNIMEHGEDKEAIAAFKIISDKVLTSPKDADSGQDQGSTLQVIITNAQGGDSQPVTIIDSQAEEINEGT